MIAIIDNGSGAEQIASIIKSKKEIVKPNEIKTTSRAYIISDGALNAVAQKNIVKLVQNSKSPIMGIGIGCAYIGAAYGAKIKATRQPKQDRLTIKTPCPLLLDLKKFFSVMRNCQYILEDVPENFSPIASSAKYEFEVMQDIKKPVFGVNFNPELGADGIKILQNFEKFVRLWENYHK